MMERTGNFPGKEARAVPNTRLDPRLAGYARAGWESVCREMQLPEGGFTERQAAQQRERYGANRPAAARRALGPRLRRAFLNPFSLTLLALCVLAWVTELLPGDGLAHEGTAPLMTGMLLLSGLVRLALEMRAHRQAQQLQRRTRLTVPVLREGRWQERDAEELVIGDRIRLRAGDPAPATVRLTRARDLFVSQSLLTGESAMTEKTPDPETDPAARPAAWRCLVWAGSTVVGGTGEGVVLALRPDAAPDEEPRRAGFDRGARSIAGVLLRFSAVLTPAIFLLSGLTKGQWGAAAVFALSAAVGLTPELLPMVVTACLARGSGALARRGTIIKDIDAMQAFGGMDLLCVDKTGTLTGDHIRLEYYLDVLGNESADALEAAWLNSRWHTGVRNHLDEAVLRMAQAPGWQEKLARLETQHPCLDELPFTYERRLASVLVRDGAGGRLLVKGAVEAVCARCSRAVWRGQTLPMGPDSERDVRAVVDEMRRDGMKVLAVAVRDLDGDTLRPEDEQDLTLLGYLAFFDAPKKSAGPAIARLRALQVPVKVLSGDAREVTGAVCRRLGIPCERVYTGADLEAAGPDDRAALAESGTVFAELTPAQKADILAILKANGHTVGYLGDGMNDLPALRQADVGIAAEGAACTAQGAAQVLLLHKDLNVLADGVREGRRVFVNMSKYLRITASSNFGNIAAVALASVALPFFPMASVQLLLLGLLYDLLCLALAWDTADEDQLRRPRGWSGRTLGRFMGVFGPVSSVFDLLTFGFLFFVLCPQVCGGAYGALDAAGQARFAALFQTGWFLESLWTQVLILHLLRTPRLPFIQSRPAAGVLAVTAAGLALFTALTFTPLGALAGMAPLPPVYFVFLAGVAALYLLTVTAIKSIYVRRYRELV